MPASNGLPRIRIGRGFPLVAASLSVGLSVTAASLQASGKDLAHATEASARPVMPKCDSSMRGAGPFVMESANDGMRTVEICGSFDRGDLSETARALGNAIQAEIGKSAFYSHPRMPELLNLRLTRARTEVDTSMSSGDRIQKLAVISYEIDALEDEISPLPHVD